MRGPVRVEADGTRVYASGHRYRPKAPEERVYAVRKPADPRAVRYHGAWFLPLELLAEARRTMPATRPDEETLEHPVWCVCEVCRRPAARRYWKRQLRS